MKKLHIIAVLILCAFFASCSSGSGSVVGKWKRTDNKDVIEFTPDGKIAFFDEKEQKIGSDWSYTADTTASPGRITVNDGTTNPKCIYKIEGSKMTMNCSVSKDADFPKDFSDSSTTLRTFERK